MAKPTPRVPIAPTPTLHPDVAETNLDLLRAALRQALINGENTTPIRDRIASMQNSLAAEADRQARDHAARQAIDAEAIQTLAEALAEEAAARHAAVMGEFKTPAMWFLA